MGKFSVPDGPFKDIATDFTDMRTQNKGIPISTGNSGQIHRMGGSDSLGERRCKDCNKVAEE